MTVLYFLMLLNSGVSVFIVWLLLDCYFIWKYFSMFINRKNDVMNLLESAGFSRSNPYYIVKQGKVKNYMSFFNRICFWSIFNEWWIGFLIPVVKLKKLYLIVLFLLIFFLLLLLKLVLTLYVAVKYKIDPLHDGMDVFKQSCSSGSCFLSDLYHFTGRRFWFVRVMMIIIILYIILS